MCVDIAEAALREVFLSYASLPEASVEERDDFLSVRTDIPLTFFNGVPRAVLDPGDAEARVREVVARHRGKGVPLRWWITPSSAPANLIEILTRNGFRHWYDAPGMAAELDSLPAQKRIEGFTITRIEEPEMLQQWANVVAAGFNRPLEEGRLWHSAFSRLGFDRQWRHFIGHLDGAPVATTSMCLSKDLAGIYHVVTLPEARGRGIGAAMTLAALLEAREHGCRVASLQSSAMAFNVYRSVGFRYCCDLATYEWRPEYESGSAAVTAAGQAASTPPFR